MSLAVSKVIVSVGAELVPTGICVYVEVREMVPASSFFPGGFLSVHTAPLGCSEMSKYSSYYVPQVLFRLLFPCYMSMGCLSCFVSKSSPSTSRLSSS